MSKTKKSVPDNWKLVVDSETLNKSLTRVCYEISEKDRSHKTLAIVGIRTGGEYIAKRIHKKLSEIESKEIAYGVIDITLYRDDLSHTSTQPTLKGTDLPFKIAGSRIILIDDVLYTGRTVRAALDAITDFGRPSVVELAALVDRGHRELPIRPDYVGKNLPTSKNQFVRVRLEEMGYEDGVYIIDANSNKNKND